MFLIIIFLLISVVSSQDCDLTQSLKDCQQNCRITYQGQKNYYNQTDLNCYAAASCNQTQIFMYNSNTCRKITPQNSSATISNNGTNNNESFTLSNFTVNKNPKIDCGNGTEYTDQSQQNYCICDSGYQDAQTIQNISVVSKCNQIIPIDIQSLYQNVNYSNSTSVNLNVNAQLSNQTASNQQLDGMNYSYIFAFLCVTLVICITLSLYFCCRLSRTKNG